MLQSSNFHPFKRQKREDECGATLQWTKIVDSLKNSHISISNQEILAFTSIGQEIYPDIMESSMKVVHPIHSFLQVQAIERLSSSGRLCIRVMTGRSELLLYILK